MIVERKIFSNIKKSQNILTMIVVYVVRNKLETWSYVIFFLPLPNHELADSKYFVR